MHFFNETALAKLEACKNYVVDSLTEHPDTKQLIFAHHAVVLNTLQHALEEKVSRTNSFSHLFCKCFES